MADSNVVVAATFVASVLEHAGYLTQARFLHDFQDFFRDAGALIYAIAGAGAVIAVVMYGSTRAAQYFLIGPALFWFLVGPTIKSEGVKWKLGGGQYLGMLREQGEEAATNYRDKVIQKMNEKNNNQAGTSIDVAIGFWLFAYPINEITNKFVDIILSKEDKEDLTAQTKIQGLELISTILPYESDHIHHIEEFASQCHQYFAAANSAAEINTRLRGKEAALKAGGKVNDTTLNEAFQTFKKRADDYGDMTYIDPIKSKMLDMLRWMSEVEVPAGDDQAKSQKAVSLAKEELKKVENGAHIKCKNAWTLIAAETWFTAKREIPRILERASGYYKFQQAREYTCDELTRKTLKDDNAKCNLEPSVALFTLYNHWKSKDTYQRIMARHRNGKDFTNPKADTIVTGPMARGFTPVMVPGADGGMTSIRRLSYNTQGQSYYEQYMYNSEDAAAVGTGKSGFDDKVRYMWLPIAPITELRGMSHAMNVASRQFDTARLKQQIVSYAYQIPYYQGVCLYMISVAYPFLALVVLLPGRAQNFLAVPLAWLWVKSWDVGFAAAIVLDKVMYNLLPNWVVSEKLQNGPWESTDDLIEVMTQGFFFDPWASIHNYYAIMAMFTISIPALTGLATLKAKKGVLSSFIDGAAAQAKNRADKAASGFSVQAQSERNHMMMQVKGLALLMSLGGNGQIDQGGRGNAAAFHAAAQTAIQHLQKADLQKLVQGDVSVLAKLPENVSSALSAYIGNYRDNAVAYSAYASQLAARFDKNIGRAGVIQHMEEAYAAAMDAGGVYEMSGISENPTEEMLALMADHYDAISTTSSHAYRLTGKLVNNTLENPLAGSLLIATASIALKEGEKLDLDTLRKMSGGEALTNEEFLTTTMSMDRFSFDTPMLRGQLQDLKERYGNDEHIGKLVNDIYGVLTKGNTPGGPSNLIELHLDAFSLQKTLGSAPPAAFNEEARKQILAAAPVVKDTSINGAIAELGKTLDQFLGADPQKEYTPVEIATAQGYKLFLNTAAEYKNDLNRRLAEYSLIGGLQPDFVEQDMQRIFSDTVYILGGPEKLAEQWNADAQLRARHINVVDGQLVFDDGKSFSPTDLVGFIVDQSEDIQNNEKFKQRLVEGFGGEDAKYDSLDTYDKMQVEAILRYQEMIGTMTFNVHGKDDPQSLVQLMEVNPHVMLQVAKDWASRMNGHSSAEGIGLVERSSLMTDPKDYSY